MAAGRLGIDPYDPDAPDIGILAEGLPEELINDISDAIAVSQLIETAEWTRGAKNELASYPTIDVAAFGEPPRDDLRIAPGEIGFRAASDLRTRLGLGGQHPKKAVDELLRGVASKEATLTERGPAPLTGLIHRSNGVAHIGTVARSARQRRFRACAATYIAWLSKSGDMRAATVAFTRQQQASRAFAAEMVAPRQYLFERSGNTGLTEEDIEKEAGKLIAPSRQFCGKLGGAAFHFWMLSLDHHTATFSFEARSDRLASLVFIGAMSSKFHQGISRLRSFVRLNRPSVSGQSRLNDMWPLRPAGGSIGFSN